MIPTNFIITHWTFLRIFSSTVCTVGVLKLKTLVDSTATVIEFE